MSLSFTNEFSTSPVVKGSNTLYRQLVQAHAAQLDVTDKYNVTILLDTPWYDPFKALPSVTTPHTLALTDNPCGEYCLDLFELGVTVLVSRQLDTDDLSYALQVAARGQRQHLGVHYESPLTKHERYVLRHAVFVSSAKELSTVLDRSPASIRNTLSSIYAKLGLKTFSDLTLYYFGGVVQL